MPPSSRFATFAALAVIFWIAYLVGDVLMYFRAPYEFRIRTWLYKLPGGGYVAWWRSRRVR